MLISLFGSINHDDGEPIKYVSLNQGKEFLIDYVTNNFSIIENMEKDDFQTRSYIKLKPYIFKPESWEMVDQDRPSKQRSEEIRDELQKSGVSVPPKEFSGTDMQIWTYENTEWDKNDMGLRADIIVEFGNILGITLHVDLDESFFI